MFDDYLKLAVKSLSRRRLRSWLTMIGIFIGIAAVVSLISLGEGLRNAVNSQFSFLGADMISVNAGGVQFGPPGTGVTKPLDRDIAPKIEKVPGVEFAVNRLLKSGKLEFNDKTTIVVAGSMPSGAHRKEIENLVNIRPKDGRLLKDGDKNRVVLGYNFLEDDIFGKPVQVGDRIIFQGVQFEVIGIADKIGNFLIDNAVFVNEDVLRDIYDAKDEVSIIVVKAEKNAPMERIKENIEKLMRKERDVKEGKEDFSVELSAETLKSLDATLFAVQIFVYIIASISLLVGGIGIANTMYTSVVERTKEIGIIKSVGARNSDIFMLFFIESGLLGLVGGLVGVLLGSGIALGLAFLGAQQLSADLIQAQISVWLIVGALLFSVIIGCLAGILPALRASKVSPIVSLRYAK